MSSLLVLALIVSTPQQAQMPKWFDNMLAGYELAYDEKHKPIGVFDAKTGFMLIRDVECDGAVVELLLTRDRKEVVHDYSYIAPNYNPAKSEGAMLAMTPKSLPNLRSGKGITIGDSPSLVRRKLGRPTKIDRKAPYTTFTFEFRSGKTEDGRDYSEAYTFRANKLVEMNFSYGPVLPSE